MVYGRKFNLLITLKALSFFDDLPTLPGDVRIRLSKAVQAVNTARLPSLTPFAPRPDETGKP